MIQVYHSAVSLSKCLKVIIIKVFKVILQLLHKNELLKELLVFYCLILLMSTSSSLTVFEVQIQSHLIEMHVFI